MKKNSTLFIFVFGTFLLLGELLLAQAPVYDVCANALVLQAFPSPNCFGAIDFSTTNATPSTMGSVPIPTCGNFSDGVTADVWFKFTSAVLATYLINVDPGTAPSATDLGMAVYTGGCAGPWTLMGCDDNSNGAGMPEISFNDTTGGVEYFLRIWSNDGTASGNFRICVVMNPTGISETEFIKTLNVLPNPFTDKLSINFSGTTPSNCILNIRDTEGAVVLSKSISTNESIINTSPLSNGIYMMEIISDHFLVSKKLIKIL
jgi:hypothetical protein